MTLRECLEKHDYKAANELFWKRKDAQKERKPIEAAPQPVPSGLVPGDST